MNGILIALIGLIAALIGGAIQAFATGRFEKTKFEREAKWQLYSSFFAALGDLSFSGRNDPKHIEALARMADIRGRIGIQGSPEVISSVGNVFRYSDLLSAESQEAMAVALSAMRADLGKSEKQITGDMLKQVMFGSRETFE